MSLAILWSTPSASSSLANLLARTHLSTERSAQRLGRELPASEIQTYQALQDPLGSEPHTYLPSFPLHFPSVSLLIPPVSQLCFSLEGFDFPGPPTWQIPPPELSQTGLASQPCSSSVPLRETFLTALPQVPKPPLPVILLPAALSEIISILFLLLGRTLLEGRDLQYWSALYPEHLKLPGPGTNEWSDWNECIPVGCLLGAYSGFEMENGLPRESALTAVLIGRLS